MDFGDRLRKARKDTKLSAREAADLAGISMDYVYKLEQGKKTNPTLDVIVKLAEAYSDPSLVQEFMRINNISDVQIDVNLSADKERIFQELSRQDPNNTIARTMFEILKNDDNALDEWAEIVKEFINKYKKPNEDKSD